jgi:hypothetical protein
VSATAKVSVWPRVERTCDGVQYSIRPIRKDDAAPDGYIDLYREEDNHINLINK